MLYDPRWKSKKRKTGKTDGEVYRAAADAIKKRGHSIGLLKDDAGRMCLWGAINFVLHGNPIRDSKRSVRLLEKLSVFTNGFSPIGWNNDPHRQPNEVVNLLRRAARASND